VLPIVILNKYDPKNETYSLSSILKQYASLVVKICNLNSLSTIKRTMSLYY